MTRAGTPQRRKTVRRTSATVDPALPVSAGHGSLHAAWAVVALLLVLPGSGYVLSAFGHPGLTSAWALPFFLVALGIWIWGCRSLPDAPAGRDWGWVPAGVVLALILALGAWMRLSHFGFIPGPYRGDSAMEIIAPLNAMEFSDYPLVFFPGAHEPLYGYLAMPFLAWLPKLPLYETQQLVSACLDLATVFLLFLLGREVGDRRTGLLAALLGAVSLTLLEKTLLGLRLILLPLTLTLALWTFLRLARKPTSGRFVFWVFSLALGAYGYTSFRAYIPFFILALLAWVWTRPEERQSASESWPWVAFVGAVTILLGLWTSGFLGLENKFWDLATPWSLLLSLGLFGLWWKFVVGSSDLRTREGLLRDWLWAVPLVWVLSLPILSDGWILNHVAAQSRNPFGVTGWGIGVGAWRTLSGGFNALAALVWGRPDPVDYSVSGDAVLGFPSLALLALGLGFLVTKPSRKVKFLLLCAAVGAAPYALSSEIHSGKLLGALPPLWVLTAWGSVRCWDALGVSGFGKNNRLAFGLALAVLLSAGGWAGYHQAYEGWALNPDHRTADTRLAVQAGLDFKDHRVFLTDYDRFYQTLEVQQALEDGRDIRRLAATNLLVERSWESPKDVVVLVMDKDGAVADRIRKEFPGAEWTEVYRAGSQAVPGLKTLDRVHLPLAQIPLKPGKLFQRFQAPDNGWTRDIFEGSCGLGRGVLQYEDWVPSLEAPSPLGEFQNLTVRYRGLFRTQGAWKVSFQSSLSGNDGIFRVDGQKQLDVRPGGKELVGEAETDLAQGAHPVEWIVRYRMDSETPILSYQLHGSGPEFRLGEP